MEEHNTQESKWYTKRWPYLTLITILLLIYILSIYNSTSTSDTYYKVSVKVLNVRTKPINGNIIHQLKDGDLVNVLLHDTLGWSKIQLPSGVVGFIYNSYITKQDTKWEKFTKSFSGAFGVSIILLPPILYLLKESDEAVSKGKQDGRYKDGIKYYEPNLFDKIGYLIRSIFSSIKYALIIALAYAIYSTS